MPAQGRNQLWGSLADGAQPLADIGLLAVAAALDGHACIAHPAPCALPPLLLQDAPKPREDSSSGNSTDAAAT